jgi:hypothetical protein
MKAIAIRFLPPTETKPSRLKASSHSLKPLVMSYDEVEGDNPEEKAVTLAGEYMKTLNWHLEASIAGAGTVESSGDYIITLRNNREFSHEHYIAQVNAKLRESLE